MKNEAIERLFKKYYNEAKLYVAALCHDEALAEDIVSESFYKAFTRIDEEKESFKFWLLKVCRNAYFDYLKKNRRLSAVHDNMAADTADLAEKGRGIPRSLPRHSSAERQLPRSYPSLLLRRTFRV